MSGDQSDASVHHMHSVQHPALLPRRKVCEERTDHAAGLVLWRYSRIRSADDLPSSGLLGSEEQ